MIARSIAHLLGSSTLESYGSGLLVNRIDPRTRFNALVVERHSMVMLVALTADPVIVSLIKMRSRFVDAQ